MKRVALLLAMAPAAAFAHHSRLFIRTTTFDLGHPRTWYFLTDASLVRAEGETEYELGPGLFYTFGEMADSCVELHGHYHGHEGEGLGFEAAGIELRHRLTFGPGVNHALGFEYEDNPDDDEPGEFIAQWIFGEETPETAWMCNLSATMANAANERVHFGYSLAWGRAPVVRTGYALELTGGLESGSAHELLPQVSFSP
jgi:hypothetical protein